ncbi:hypothetical protein R1flu_023521 [Riccia fluitans]|uniref:Uncharacterized protein n=1 Tax=Riccia fluitans TaxID=41844 RepID=A0ABD1XSB3_9MARC
MSHSPNLDKVDQKAFMQNIDRLVEAIEMEAKESRMSKCRKLFLDEASSSAVKVYQTPEQSIVPSFPNFGITLEELSVMSGTRAEWDDEKGELVCEREALKEELNKAKEMAVEAEQRMEVVRLAKEALQQQYTTES